MSSTFVMSATVERRTEPRSVSEPPGSQVSVVGEHEEAAVLDQDLLARAQDRPVEGDRLLRAAVLDEGAIGAGHAQCPVDHHVGQAVGQGGGRPYLVDEAV